MVLLDPVFLTNKCSHTPVSTALSYHIGQSEFIRFQRAQIMADITLVSKR
jgi:hypothetical protein